MRVGLKQFNDPDQGSLIHIDHTDVGFAVDRGATIEGLEIFYPRQVSRDPFLLFEPVSPLNCDYTFWIMPNAHGVTIRHIACPNPYQFIKVGGRPGNEPDEEDDAVNGTLIQNIWANPYFRGITASRCADVLRIDQIHFNGAMQSLSSSPKLVEWIRTNAVAMSFGWCEGLNISNFFCFGYLRGIWFGGAPPFIQKTSVDAVMTNIQMDHVFEGILITGSIVDTRQGLSVTNMKLIPVLNQPAGGVGVRLEDNGGNYSVQLVNCDFFGQWHQRSIRIGPNSNACLQWINGHSTEYKFDMVLVQNPAAQAHLVGVRSFGGQGPRINNPSNAWVSDVVPIIN
jgi:hypothetical protein